MTMQFVISDDNGIIFLKTEASRDLEFREYVTSAENNNKEVE